MKIYYILHPRSGNFDILTRGDWFLKKRNRFMSHFLLFWKILSIKYDLRNFIYYKVQCVF
jgi:hypothetical protein